MKKIRDFFGGSVVRWFGGSDSTKNHGLRHMASYGKVIRFTKIIRKVRYE